MESLDTTLHGLHVLSDRTRVRLLCLLEAEELSVVELTTITELPQSRVSTHLGKLREAGIVRDRRVGANSFYALNREAMPEPVKRLWGLMRGELSDPVLVADAARADKLKKGETSLFWPDSIAGEMERHYSPGRTWEATARGLLSFLALGEVLDVGAGDGAVAQLVAPHARSVTCLDHSERMIAAAERRLAHYPNVRCLLGDMHALPFDPHSFDAVLLLNVLAYSSEPDRALAEAARVLRIGGSLAVVTLNAHSHAEVTSSYGHQNTGLSPSEVEQALVAAGLSVLDCSVTSRERTHPYFEVITAHASRARPGAENSETA